MKRFVLGFLAAVAVTTMMKVIGQATGLDLDFIAGWWALAALLLVTRQWRPFNA